VLALDYMKRTKKLTPEVHAKAEGFIANGYQRLLTFEVPGGGFSWFGQAPANKILTAYGLMEFSDMSKVYDVDPKLIERTQQWLAAQQQADGSWKPDTNFINEGATNRYNSDVLRITAYLAWSLENTGYQGPAVEKARQYVAAHERHDGRLHAGGAGQLRRRLWKDREFTGRPCGCCWTPAPRKTSRPGGPRKRPACTAPARAPPWRPPAWPCSAAQVGPGSATAARRWLYRGQEGRRGHLGHHAGDHHGAARAAALHRKGAADVRGTVEISLNGKPVEKLTLTPENNDLLHQFVFKGVDAKAANNVESGFDGKGGLAYQVVGRYFLPWTEKPAGEPLSIDVAYDRTRLAQDDIATATATVKNNLPSRPTW
jgi:alpha-2-macroglobulin-like protein